MDSPFRTSVMSFSPDEPVTSVLSSKQNLSGLHLLMPLIHKPGRPGTIICPIHCAATQAAQANVIASAISATSVKERRKKEKEKTFILAMSVACLKMTKRDSYLSCFFFLVKKDCKTIVLMIEMIRFDGRADGKTRMVIGVGEVVTEVDTQVDVRNKRANQKMIDDRSFYRCLRTSVICTSVSYYSPFCLDRWILRALLLLENEQCSFADVSRRTLRSSRPNSQFFRIARKHLSQQTTL